MGLAELTRGAVLAAISEYDQHGRQAFLLKYGFHRSQAYWLAYNGSLYDSKAIAGAAHGHLHGSSPLPASDFSGGAATVQKQLEQLGFDVVHLPPEWSRWELLQALKLYVDAGALGGKPIPTETDPRVVDLSQQLRRQASDGLGPLPEGFRSTGSVIQKLANLRSCEREVALAHGVAAASGWPVGSSHVARADRALMEEFWDRWDTVDEALAEALAEERHRTEARPGSQGPLPNVFVLTWNPKYFDLDLENDAWELARSGRLAGRWSVGTRNSGIAVGDTLLLLRVGRDAGLIRRGVATSSIFPELHWDPARAQTGQQANYVHVDWLEQSATNQPLRRETLNFDVPQVNWTRLQGSGVRLAAGVAADVLTLWNRHLRDAESERADQLGPEVAGALNLADQAAGRPPRRAGRQGIGLTAAQRRTVELHAMAAARALLEPDWEVQDVSSNSSYDLRCTRGAEELHVEVKGTTSGPEEVIVTANEVVHHREHAPASALIVVHSIAWSDARRSEVSGGEILVVDPWNIDAGALRPISYRYQVPGGNLPPG